MLELIIINTITKLTKKNSLRLKLQINVKKIKTILKLLIEKIHRI